MPPTIAKVRAYNYTVEGVVVREARKRVLVRYQIAKGKKEHETWFNIVADETTFNVNKENGTAFIPGRVKVEPKVVLKTDKEGVQLRRAAEPEPYPEGSVRERRQALMIKASELGTQIKECKRCNDLRAERAKAIQEAESLLISAATEGEAEGGSRKVKKIIIKAKGEDDAGEE